LNFIKLVSLRATRYNLAKDVNLAQPLGIGPSPRGVGPKKSTRQKSPVQV